MKSTKNLLAATLLVGSTLGAIEAAWILRGMQSVTASELVLLFFYSTAGYGILAVLTVLLWLLGEWIGPKRIQESPLWSVAVGCAVAMFSSVHFVLRLVMFADKRLLPFIAGCILTGAACGLIAGWLTSRVSILQRRSTWMALLVLAVLCGIALMPAIFSGLKPDPALSSKSKDQQTNILLISVDTLRRDHLGCYGFKTAQTPHIDRIAQQGALFEDATSPVPLTGPSHITMLTGLDPWNHGVIANGIPLHGSITLPEILSKSGYVSAAFVSGWTLKNYSTDLASRFNQYDEDFAIWSGFPDIVLRVGLPKLFVRAYWFLTGYQIFQLERPAENTTSRALSWLTSHKSERFFLFVHYFDTHEPHLPPPPYDRTHAAAARGKHPEFLYDQPKKVRQKTISDPVQIEHIKALYDGEISYVDNQIGRLLKGIEDIGLSKNLLIIFTADHGQSLTEHESYFRHGEFLYETCVKVPLILQFPGNEHAGTRYSSQVRLSDIAPTIASILGLEPKIKFDGESLLPIVQGSESKSRISYGAIRMLRGEHERSRYYVKQDGYKLIWNYDLRKEFSDVPVFEELYDLRKDPGELQNVVSNSLVILDPLRKLMSIHVRHERPSIQIPDEQVREALESLGYL